LLWLMKQTRIAKNPESQMDIKTGKSSRWKGGPPEVRTGTRAGPSAIGGGKGPSQPQG
jgi:hypothetical protein